MKIYIIIPAHNEEEFLSKTLESLLNQSFLPKKIVLVDDNSTDRTAAIAEEFAKRSDIFSILKNTSSEAHLPGSKVVNAFYKAYETLDEDYDLICKFDADLIFPLNYLEKLVDTFKKDPKIGMAGGFCYIQKGSGWVLEKLTNKDHIRGALKAYRRECFLKIGKIKPAMGWDSIDELLAQYHGWKVQTLEDLQVKHLKPTGKTYNKAARYKQGEAFYRMRYGFNLTCIASLKLAYMKKDLTLSQDYITGFLKAKKAKKAFLVSEAEGFFIRKLRWQKMKEKFL